MPGLGRGAVKVRDDPKHYNTSSEKSILYPDPIHYAKVGQQCTKDYIGVDLFLTMSG